MPRQIPLPRGWNRRTKAAIKRRPRRSRIVGPLHPSGWIVNWSASDAIVGDRLSSVFGARSMNSAFGSKKGDATSTFFRVRNQSRKLARPSGYSSNPEATA